MMRKTGKDSNRRFAATVLPVLLLCVLMLSGCGEADPVIGTAALNTFDKTLTVATDDDYWPYVYYDAEGRLTGHDIELINLVANGLNMNLELRPMSWNESLDAVRAGEADAVLTCEYTGREVEDGIITTSPVKSDDFVVFARKRIDSLDELYGKLIGVMKNGNVVRSVVEHGLEERCIYYDTNRAAFDALAEGKCDCVIVRYIIGLGILEEMGPAADGIDGYISLSDSRSCIGVSDENQSLANQISGVIGTLRADGTLDQLNEKWIRAHYPEHTFQGFVKKYQGIIIAVAAVLAAVIVTGYITQHLSYRKRLNAKMEQNRALEEARRKADAANEAKSIFLFNMSHDIRTPINAIKGFTNIAVKNLDDREKAADALSKAQGSCDVLIELVTDILDMSRIESGKAELHENSTDLGEIFTNIRPMLEEQAAGKRITVTFDAEGLRDRRVMCDVTHTHRILVNLVSNAIRYTQEGGRVWVKAEQLGEADGGIGRYRFTVKDNGYGMSPAYQKIAFELFTREESSTVSGVQGTGLGLPLCKRIAELMGGTVSVVSEQGIGSEFTVELPLKLLREDAAEIGTEPPAASGGVSLKGRTVLLAEDNELNREIAVEILTAEGISVDTAEDGRVAVEKLRQNGPEHYDCVLMDIQMPYMNGYEATKAIRALYPEAKLPIIALSANAFEEDRRRSLEAGMNAHLSKPIDVPRLLKTLSELLG